MDQRGERLGSLVRRFTSAGVLFAATWLMVSILMLSALDDGSMGRDAARRLAIFTELLAWSAGICLTAAAVGALMRAAQGDRDVATEQREDKDWYA